MLCLTGCEEWSFFGEKNSCIEMMTVRRIFEELVALLVMEFNVGIKVVSDDSVGEDVGAFL